MKIDKALKKQKKYKGLFFAFMFFLAIILPIITYLSYMKSLYIMFFLAIIEILIFLAIISKMNYYELKFSFYNNKLKFRSGLFSKESVILCDKVAVVHTNKSKEDIEIIIITRNKFKNKKLKPLTKVILDKYPEIEKEIEELKKIDNNHVYYFQVIKRGALRKYLLLDNIYRNCVNSIYTYSAIENIKIARGQNEI